MSGSSAWTIIVRPFSLAFSRALYMVRFERMPVPSSLRHLRPSGRFSKSIRSLSLKPLVTAMTWWISISLSSLALFIMSSWTSFESTMGLVLPIRFTVVKPPARAALEPVSRSSL